MSDTYALDHFFDNGNWQSGDDGDWQYVGEIDPKRASSELTELYLERGELTFRRKQFLETDDQLSKLRIELNEYKECRVSLLGTIDQLRAEIEKLGIDLGERNAWIKAHVDDFSKLRAALTKADLIFQAAERQRGPLRYAAEDWRKEYSHLVTESKG